MSDTLAGPSIAEAVLDWSRRLFNQAEIGIFLGRGAAASELSNERWLDVGLPEVSFEPQEFAPRAAVRFGLDWDIALTIGSARYREDPLSAYQSSWQIAQRLLDDITTGDGPDIASAYDVLPVDISVNTQWGADDDNPGQTVLIFTIQILTRGF